MKIENNPYRLSTSRFYNNIFNVVVDYEDDSPTLYGKSVKDTIIDFQTLKKCSNFSEYELQVIKQMPFLALFYEWIKFKNK